MNCLGRSAFLASTDGISVNTKSGGFNGMLSGEGLVCKFQGPGTVWMQTRNPANLVANTDRK